MSMSIKFELIEIYPEVSEILQDSDEILRLVLSYGNQIIEENAGLMLSNGDSSQPLFVPKNDLKVSVKLLKDSISLGSGELAIPKSIIQKGEEMKKWVTIKSGSNSETKKGNLAMNIINSVRLCIKTIFTSSEIGNINLSMSDVGSSKKTNPTSSINSLSNNNSSSVMKNPNNSVIEKFKDNSNNSYNMSSFNSAGSSESPNKKRNKNLSCGTINNPHSSEKLNNSISANFMKGQSALNSERKQNKLTKSLQKDHSNIITTEVSQTVEEKGKNEAEKVDKSSVKGSNNKKGINIGKVQNLESGSKSKKVNFVENKESQVEENNIKEVNKNNSVSSEEKEENLSDLSDSFIDQIFQEESDNFVDQIASNKFETSLNEFQTYYNEDLVSILPDDEIYLKFEIKMMVEKLFEMQQNYYSDFRVLNNRRQSFNYFFDDYNEKFRVINKQMDRLKEQVVSNHMNHSRQLFLNKEEINRTKEGIELANKELELYRSLFLCKYDKRDVEEFVQRERNIEREDKAKLFQLAEIIFSKPEVREKLTNGQSMLLNKLLKPQSENADNLKKSSNLSFNNLNVVYASRNSETREPNKLLNYTCNVENSKSETLAQSFNTNSTHPNLIESKLNDTLRSIYEKKNIPRIEFKKISDGIFDYGSQKVYLKLGSDGEIKVQKMSEFKSLEQYLESNAEKEFGKSGSNKKRNSVNIKPNLKEPQDLNKQKLKTPKNKNQKAG